MSAFTGRMHCVCSHCQKEFELVPCIPANDGETTHGICEPCLRAHYPEIAADVLRAVRADRENAAGMRGNFDAGTTGSAPQFQPTQPTVVAAAPSTDQAQPARVDSIEGSGP